MKVCYQLVNMQMELAALLVGPQVLNISMKYSHMNKYPTEGSLVSPLFAPEGVSN